MRVTSLGHAGLMVETSAATVLLDPWFSPEGAFQASWFPFPDNSHLLDAWIPLEPTAIVLSHEHQDHLDPWFLSRIASNVPIVIPRYPSPVMKNKIEQATHNPVVEIRPWQEVELAGGTRVFFVSEQSPMNHDSAIILQGDGHTLLDLNDARLFPLQFRTIRSRAGGTIDVFAFQGAGASWYPICYEYPRAKLDRLAREKRLVKFRYAARCIDLIEPAVAVPFAGPAAFLDPQLFHHNAQMEDGIFPDQQQVATWLDGWGHSDSVILLPGDAWDVHAMEKECDPHWLGFSFADRWSYLADYALRRKSQLSAVLSRYPDPVESLWSEFRNYFERMLDMSPYFNAEIGMRIGFHVSGPGGGQWAVDFRPGQEGVVDEAGDCSYEFRFESRWLPSLLDGSTPWEDFLLSLRFAARREPDQYNDHLLGLLKFAQPDALDAVESCERSLESNERVTLEAGGNSYSVSRYCPHAGNDLLETGAIADNGILQCLAHHYAFDLETGRCVNGKTAPLAVERITPHLAVDS